MTVGKVKFLDSRLSVERKFAPEKEREKFDVDLKMYQVIF